MPHALSSFIQHFVYGLLKSQVPLTVINPHTVQPTEKLKNTLSIYTGNSFSSCIFQGQTHIIIILKTSMTPIFEGEKKIKVLKNNSSLLREAEGQGANQLFLVTGITCRVQARLRKVSRKGLLLLGVTIPFLSSICFIGF